MKFDEPLIRKAYDIAKRYYEKKGKIRITDARNELSKLGVNPNSAVDMIYNFKHLLEGERYTRQLSVLATKLYLKWIEKDYSDALPKAISALRQHIEYYQTLTGAPMNGLMAILGRYEAARPQKPSIYTSPEEVGADLAIREGCMRIIRVNAYERSPQARKLCIQEYGAACAVCSFDFQRKYGALGRGFIHVHHLQDISLIKEEYEVDPIKDLRPVCPNCHAMLHKSKPAYSIQQLKKIIRKNKERVQQGDAASSGSRQTLR